MQYVKGAINDVKPSTWFFAIIISSVFLLFLFYFVDWKTIKQEIYRINWVYLSLAFFVLSLEGFFTALRVQVFTPGDQKISDCLKLTAWFVVMLVILPARTGEVFVLVLYKHILNQKTGMSIMNVIAQRILDMLVLAGVFLIALILISREFGMYLFEITMCLAVLLIIALMLFEKLLGCVSRGVFFMHIRYKYAVFKKILRLLLQARIWYQHYMNIYKMYKAMGLTVMKWVCNLAGLMLVFYSLNLPVDFIETLFLSASYNFMGIIPLQGIGGIGFSEVGLTGLLVLLDIAVEQAATSSIFMRVVAIVNPFIFFFAVMMLLLLDERFRKTRR